MQQFIRILIATLLMISSQASMSQSGDTRHTVSATQVRTATRSVAGSVKIPRISKPKLFRSNPYRAAYYVTATDPDTEIGINDDDKMSGYRRRDLQKIHNEVAEDPDELSEEIRWKLFLARQLALLKYKETHS
jgi:hypothetical protein